MRIGLFGGAFDPFHNGHLAICGAAKESAKLDRLIVIPTGRAPHKGEFSAGFEDRYNMAVLALEGTGFEVSRYEGEREELSYSASTVEHFHALYPGDELFFLIGADSYKYFASWHEPWRITDVATLVVFPRSGVEVSVLPPAIAAKMKEVEISSTSLRRRLRAGRDVGGLLPRKVNEYIIEHNLYT